MPPKQAEKKTFKITTAPEGQPTFIDSTSGRERPYLRVHLVRAYSLEEAKKVVNDSNRDVSVQYGEPFYEIMSVETEEE